MDLSALVPSTDEIIVELTYKNPKGKETKLTKKDGKPCTITMWAPHSKVYKEYVYSLVDESIKKSKNKEDDTFVSAKEVDEKRVHELFVLTKSWDVELNGVPLEFTEENIKNIYSKSQAIVSQIERALKSNEDFI